MNDRWSARAERQEHVLQHWCNVNIAQIWTYNPSYFYFITLVPFSSGYSPFPVAILFVSSLLRLWMDHSMRLLVRRVRICATH